jgi:hypothetical protein
MAAQLNLQRNTKVFISTVDLASGAAVTSVVPANTWQVEILAGYAVSQATATQDITSVESGTAPDRSQQRFRTALNPVDWNFQAYLKPTGAENTTTAGKMHRSGNSMPVADWFMWQAMMSNTPFSSGTVPKSVWQDLGKFAQATRSATANVYDHSSNFSTANEYHIYFQMDNVIYQVSNATVNQGSIDAAIDGIATTTWTGFGTNLIELRDTVRDNAVAIFGGILASGSSVNANSNAYIMTAYSSYHPWNSYNVVGVISSASFIKNRLSTIEIIHAPTATATPVTFTFPVTALSFDYNNNLTYLTPEELSSLNAPIGQFAGTRAISGSLSAYLRSNSAGSNDSAQFLKQVVEDRRTTSSATSSANLRIGGSTAPYFAIKMPAVQFELPTHAIEDIIGISVNFLAQETSKGTGDEITLIVNK